MALLTRLFLFETTKTPHPSRWRARAVDVLIIGPADLFYYSARFVLLNWSWIRVGEQFLFFLFTHHPAVVSVSLSIRNIHSRWLFNILKIFSAICQRISYLNISGNQPFLDFLTKYLNFLVAGEKKHLSVVARFVNRHRPLVCDPWPHFWKLFWLDWRRHCRRRSSVDAAARRN